MKSFTITSRRLRISNPWIRDILSEVLATYVFVLLSVGVVAQEVVNGFDHSSTFVINLAISIALTMAVYISGNASGGYVNPGIALCMCLTGYLEWRKYPVFVCCYFIGAFLAAATVYGIYYDAIITVDGGVHQISGVNGTGHIFTSYPSLNGTSKTTAFVEVMVAHALLVGCTLALADSRNMFPSKGLVPIPIGLSVFTVCSAFSHYTPCPINATKDLAPRLLLLAVGYGDEAFAYCDYWFWIPPAATTLGSLLATLVYQLCIGLQWGPIVDLNEEKNNRIEPFALYTTKKPFLGTWITTDFQQIHPTEISRDQRCVNKEALCDGNVLPHVSNQKPSFEQQSLPGQVILRPANQEIVQRRQSLKCLNGSKVEQQKSMDF